jgi:cell division septum initiation protein DivIVA
LGWINTALSLVALLAASGIAIARFRTDTDNESARLWKENAEAEKNRADRLEATVRDLTSRVERLEVENDVLRSLVTGERAISDLSSVVIAQHQEVMAALRGRGGVLPAPETRAGVRALDKDSGAS